MTWTVTYEKWVPHSYDKGGHFVNIKVNDSEIRSRGLQTTQPCPGLVIALADRIDLLEKKLGGKQ